MDGDKNYNIRDVLYNILAIIIIYIRKFNFSKTLFIYINIWDCMGKPNASLQKMIICY